MKSYRATRHAKSAHHFYLQKTRSLRIR
jgi:hypothetical protein